MNENKKIIYFDGTPIAVLLEGKDIIQKRLEDVIIKELSNFTQGGIIDVYSESVCPDKFFMINVIKNIALDTKSLGIFFAFDAQQFAENVIGEPPYVRILGDGFISKSKEEYAHKYIKAHQESKKELMQERVSPKLYFEYEFVNQECNITFDLQPAYDNLSYYYGKEIAERVTMNKKFIKELYNKYEGGNY